MGPHNDTVIEQPVAAADLIIAAWGVIPAGIPAERAEAVLNTPTRHVDVHRLGDPTATGHPRHPLYLSANAALVLHAGCRP